MINLFLKNIENHPVLITIILFLLGGFGTIIWFFIKKRFSKDTKIRDIRKEKIIARVKLIYLDIEKNKRKFEKIRGLIGKEKFTHIKMSMTHFSNIDYAEMQMFLGRDCVEHLPNIKESVFEKWNKMI